MNKKFDNNFWSAIIALAALAGLAVSLYTFSNQRELQVNLEEADRSFQEQLFLEQQEFQKSLEKELIKMEILKDARNTIMRNGSRINVIVLLELRDNAQKNLSNEVIKELLSLQTEIVFNYVSIDTFLSSFQKKSLEKNLESIKSMFTELIDNQYTLGSADKYRSAIYSFSEGVVDELDKILLDKEDIK